MNRNLTRVVSMLCVVLVFFGIFAVTAVAATYENDLPNVYLEGQYQDVYNKKGKKVWPVSKSITDILLDNRKELISAFSTSLLTSDWTVYGNALGDALDKSYSAGTLDKDGNPKNGTAIKASPTPKTKTSNFSLSDYYFKYDPRLDPWETATKLDSYINAVLKATGKKKVNLIGRCMGGVFVSAYLERYGRSKVDTVIHYASAAKGAKVSSELFAGKLYFDADDLNNYANEYMGDDDLSALLSGVINVTYTLNMLGLGTEMVQDIFNQISVDVFPDLLRRTYATMPAYWAMVDEENYEQAKNYVFGGCEAEYAGLIKKIDNYHNKVKVNIDSTLKNYQKNGLKVAIIAKYNKPFPPYIEGHATQGDGTVAIPEISFGGTAAEIGKALSVDYLNAAKESGTIKYISDDLIVDSSSCLFPKYTWFIRDIEHGTIPSCINSLILKILRSKKQVNVSSFKEYPQFTSYSYETKKLTPITAPIPSGSINQEQTGMLNILDIFKGIFKIILNLFSIVLK